MLRSQIAVALIAAFSLAGRSGADVCVYKPSVVRHICGVVFDTRGNIIQDGTLTLLQNGVAVRSVQSAKGFDFSGSVSAGTYDLRAEAANYQSATYRITVAKPEPSCKRRLIQVFLAVGKECGDIRVVPVRRK